MDTVGVKHYPRVMTAQDRQDFRVHLEKDFGLNRREVEAALNNGCNFLFTGKGREAPLFPRPGLLGAEEPYGEEGNV
jgi:hypothetical protein